MVRRSSNASNRFSQAMYAGELDLHDTRGSSISSVPTRKVRTYYADEKPASAMSLRKGNRRKRKISAIATSIPIFPNGVCRLPFTVTSSESGTLTDRRCCQIVQDETPSPWENSVDIATIISCMTSLPTAFSFKMTLSSSWTNNDSFQVPVNGTSTCPVVEKGIYWECKLCMMQQLKKLVLQRSFCIVQTFGAKILSSFKLKTGNKITHIEHSKIRGPWNSTNCYRTRDQESNAAQESFILSGGSNTKTCNLPASRSIPTARGMNHAVEHREALFVRFSALLKLPL